MKLFLTRTLFISICLLPFLSISAQDKRFTLGVKAGFNMSNFGGDLKRSDLDDINPKAGYNVGVTVDFAFSPDIYLLTGLEFTTKGAYEYRKGKEISVDAMYMNIPLQLGYKMQIDNKPKFVSRIGPYIGYGIAGKTKTKELNKQSNTFSTEGLKKIDLGIGAAVGIEVNNIAVDLGYNFGLLDISRTKEKIRVRNFFANLGYKF